MLFAAIGLRYAFPIDVYISSGFSRNEDAQCSHSYSGTGARYDDTEFIITILFF